jgi:hypothetical protein
LRAPLQLAEVKQSLKEEGYVSTPFGFCKWQSNLLFETIKMLFEAISKLAGNLLARWKIVD